MLRSDLFEAHGLGKVPRIESQRIIG